MSTTPFWLDRAGTIALSDLTDDQLLETSRLARQTVRLATEMVTLNTSITGEVFDDDESFPPEIDAIVAEVKRRGLKEIGTQEAIMDFKLGLGPTPDPVYLYVGETETESPACWYKLDSESKQIPVTDPALTGYLVGLRVTEREFKGKVNFKLDLVVKADRNYVIRSGVETQFSRGVLLALNEVVNAGALEAPLVIAVQRGDEDKVIFGRVFYADTGEKIKPEWDGECKLLPIIQKVQATLGVDTFENGTEVRARHEATA